MCGHMSWYTVQAMTVAVSVTEMTTQFRPVDCGFCGHWMFTALARSRGCETVDCPCRNSCGDRQLSGCHQLSGQDVVSPRAATAGPRCTVGV